MSTIPSVQTNTVQTTATIPTGPGTSATHTSTSQVIEHPQSIMNGMAATMSRLEIGAMIKAQILQVQPIQSNPTPATHLMTLTTLPLSSSTLIYTPATLEKLTLDQLAINPLLVKSQNQIPLHQNSISLSAISLKESMQLAIISPQYQLIVDISGKRFALLSSLPFRTDEIFLLQKMNAHSWQVLTGYNQRIKTTTFLPSFVTKTQPTANYLQHEWQFSNSNLPLSKNVDNHTTLSMPPLPKPITQFFQTLLAVQQVQAKIRTAIADVDRPSLTSSTLTTLVHLLKNSINNSGLTFEHKLAAFSRLPPNEQTQLLKLWQQGSNTREDINFTKDQKFALANLFAALLNTKEAIAANHHSLENRSFIQWLAAIKKLLPTVAQTGFLPEDTASARDKQHFLWQNFFFPTTPMTTTGQEENSYFLGQLLEQIKQQFNRTHVQQLQSLLPTTDTQTDRKDNNFSFCFDLPLLTDKGYERIPIWIEGEQKKATKPNKSRSQWRLVLAFDLPDLGKIIADCRLTPPENQQSIKKSALKMQFFSEKSSTNHRIDEHISDLTYSLQAIGLDVSHQACRSPLPPLGDQRFQHNWVHLQI
jgi:hypothetical protein